ncbi:hypothetical protein IC619_015200 [Hazenella sp. IB182353]|uniref:hypothetical protein n=1 Tax=Polycladospora coralii TaxID=2771432 RepID=UPI0017464A65|nr:hypothetical protein [Polycladospora coralii]MBS7531818.1 hypothetical protein [Polycladospora coralii]
MSLSTEIRSATVNFGQTHDFNFAGEVIQSEVFLKGFNISYVSKDHHIKSLHIESARTVAGDTITVSVVANMQDGSGNHQDNSLTSVTVVVIAVVDS